MIYTKIDMYNKNTFRHITKIINNHKDSKNGHFSARSAIRVYSAFINGYNHFGHLVVLVA